MPSAYPGAIDTFTDPSGTSPLATGPDHAADHTTLHSAVGTIQYTLGTNSGTAVLKNATAGKFAVMNTGGTLDAGVLGTPMVRGGTLGTVLLGTSTITGGTANTLTLGTPTITGGSLGVSGTSVSLTVGAALSPTVGTITDTVSGTLTVNAQAANVYRSVMGTTAGNRTVGTPTNLTDGQVLTYAFKASGSANGTLVWQSVFRLSQDAGTPSIGTGTTWNYYSWRYNGIDSKLDFQGQSKNII